MPEPVQLNVTAVSSDDPVDSLSGTASKPRPLKCGCQACRQHRNPAHDAALARNEEPPPPYMLSVYKAYLSSPEPCVMSQQENKAALWLQLFQVRE